MAVIHITDVESLQDMVDDLTADYVLDVNINMTGQTWIPVGSWGTPFTGSFDGQGHTISHLSYNDAGPGLGYAGMFGIVDDATIKNLVLTNVSMIGGAYCGGLIAYCNGINVSNVQLLNVIVNGGNDIGGLIGVINSIPAVINDVTVTNVTLTGTADVGGMIGSSFGGSNIQVTNSGVFNYTMPGGYRNGGFLGSGTGVFEYCKAQGTILGQGAGFCAFSEGARISHCEVTVAFPNGGSSCGGFVGSTCFGDIFQDCIAHINYTSSANEVYVGGFVGSASQDFIIKRCYTDGDINMTGSCNYVGGFVGTVFIPQIHDCYSRVNINAPNSEQVGGFVGLTDGGGLISNCYASGSVVGASLVGGFVGQSNGSDGGGDF